MQPGLSSSALYLPMGQRIRGVREAAGLTQQQLATTLNVTQATVSQWENGHRAPRTPNDWIALANALHADLDWIIRGQPREGYASGWNDRRERRADHLLGVGPLPRLRQGGGAQAAPWNRRGRGRTSGRVTQAALAERYGVSRGNLSKILNRKAYTDVR